MTADREHSASSISRASALSSTISIGARVPAVRRREMADRLRSAIDCLRRLGTGRQANLELAAVAGAVAAHRHRSAVRLDERAHQREADAKTGADAGLGRLPLVEQLEHLRELLRRGCPARCP